MQAEEAAVFEGFPKQRPELPEAYRDIYVSHYAENRGGGSRATAVAQRLEAWMHRQVAKGAEQASGPTLEIGAGSLNHLPYEPNCERYDIVEPFSELYEDSPWRGKVGSIFGDVAEVDRSGYERIVSIACFEHLCDLPEVVARCGVLLAGDGALRVAIPSEGGWLWKLAYTCTTGLEFRLHHGLDYGTLMRYEHVNRAHEIETVLRYFFSEVSIRMLGVSRGSSLYQAFVCRSARLDRCGAQLGSGSSTSDKTATVEKGTPRTSG